MDPDPGETTISPEVFHYTTPASQVSEVLHNCCTNFVELCGLHELHALLCGLLLLHVVTESYPTLQSPTNHMFLNVRNHTRVLGTQECLFREDPMVHAGQKKALHGHNLRKLEQDHTIINAVPEPKGQSYRKPWLITAGPSILGGPEDGFLPSRKEGELKG